MHRLGRRPPAGAEQAYRAALSVTATAFLTITAATEHTRRASQPRPGRSR
jgi:hypothetical protein